VIPTEGHSRAGTRGTDYGPAAPVAGPEAGIWSLRRLHLFAGLGAREIRALSGILREAIYRRGQYLFHMGDRADRLYFLQKGVVKVSVVSQTGNERILEVFRPGDTFGELFLMTGARRVYTAQAMTSVLVYTATGEAFRALIQTRPDLSHSFIRHLVQQQRRAMLRLQALLTLEAGPRLLATLVDIGERVSGATQAPAWRLVLSQDDLARMIGLHRSTVSTWINTYRRKGVLGGRGKVIVIRRARARAALVQAGFPLA
jgi:CRP-like cAMP-binding protein